jgi:glycerophosphoryl diester phosphodiesterase
VRVYGHRGYAAAYPENSVAGVVAAFEAGAYGVEIDVRRTADDQLLLSHDVLPADLSGLASLAAVLDAARGHVVIEVKNMPGEPDFDAPVEATAKLLVDALAARDGDDVTVSSFDWFAIEVARDAGLPTAFLSPPGLALEAALGYVDDAGHAECHPHWSAVLEAPEVVSLAHEHGRTVVCWTVDDVDVARALRDAGVDGVITNDPALLLRGLDDH